MGSLAQLALALGHRVTGSDQHVYPPMSDQLRQAGIELIEGFDPRQLSPAPDLILVGNVISRGNPAMESILNHRLPYQSGPQWLSEQLLQHKWVLAVAGTHGKTTTASMLAWILEYAGMSPGFLIGGVPGNFPVSARLGETDFFVIEADEYDTAFFDKRSKFVHYHPRTLILNNLEFDHADIFPNLAAIQTQFHHLMRLLPADGLAIRPANDSALEEVINLGCWSPQQTFASDRVAANWQYAIKDDDAASFDVLFDGRCVGTVHWSLSGLHNLNNALAAIAAARHVGVLGAVSCEALCHFAGVKRRMECVARWERVLVYDDFAHHPTAILTTLAGARAAHPDHHLIAVLEPRSNTMVRGVHREHLRSSVVSADQVFWFKSPAITWDMRYHLSADNVVIIDEMESLISAVTEATIAQMPTKPVAIVIMSNGGFNGYHRRLIQSLAHALTQDSPISMNITDIQ